MDHNDERIPYIFNGMATEYDELSDLWYSWLFSRLHYFIAAWITKTWPSSYQRVLDIGCGTGFQSFLYAQTGAEVYGIDVADKLVEQAKRKAVIYLSKAGRREIFPVYHAFVSRYHSKTYEVLKSRFATASFTNPSFRIASALEIPFENSYFSHINCCGSVLSFIQDYEKALDEMARVLRPNGFFVIEVESRYNFDLVWPFLDIILGGYLEYETSFHEALSPLVASSHKPITVEYPFGDKSNPVYMPIILFTKSLLQKELIKRNLLPLEWKTIHSFTNLIPSTLLDSSRPTPLLKWIFNACSRVEEFFPYQMPGCSLIVFGQKVD